MKKKNADLDNRDCLFCGVSFTPKKYNQLYCCVKHRNRVYQPVESVCNFCSKSYWKDKVNQDFCSKNCNKLHHIQNFERPKIPKTVFVGTREEIVSKLTVWLEENGYIGD